MIAVSAYKVQTIHTGQATVAQILHGAGAAAYPASGLTLAAVVVLDIEREIWLALARRLACLFCVYGHSLMARHAVVLGRTIARFARCRASLAGVFPEVLTQRAVSAL